MAGLNYTNLSALTKDKFIPILVDNIFNSNAVLLKLLKNAEKLYFEPLRNNFQKRPIAEQMTIGFWSDPILGKTIGWGYQGIAKPLFKPVPNLVKKAKGGTPLELTDDIKSTVVKYVDTEETLMKVFGQDKIINNTF